MTTTQATLTDPHTRERLSASATRGFLGLSGLWGLTEAQQLTLLGASISRPTLGVWKSGGAKTTLNIDQLMRISLLLGIHEGLERFFRRAPAESAAWLRRPRPEEPFDGLPPLEMMLQRGIPGLQATRQYIEGAAGGPPSRSWHTLGLAGER
jgi:hypothetical protein